MHDGRRVETAGSVLDKGNRGPCRWQAPKDETCLKCHAHVRGAYNGEVQLAVFTFTWRASLTAYGRPASSRRLNNPLSNTGGDQPSVSSVA